MVLSNWASDGTLVAASSIGGASGSLPGSVTLTDGGSTILNEHMHVISGAKSVAFDVSATEYAPEAGAFPDSLAIYLLNAASDAYLFDTTDPLGVNALSALDLVRRLPCNRGCSHQWRMHPPCH